jgi:plasmid replication initiation protein
MSPFLLQLENNFTSIKSIDLTKPRSKFSKRILYLLKKNWNQNRKEPVYELRKLKDILGLLTYEYDTKKDDYNLVQEKMKVFNNFKIKVLEVAKKELQEISEFYFDYETIRKSSRKITHIKFFIKRKKTDYHADLTKKEIVEIEAMIRAIRDGLWKKNTEAIK